MSASTRRAVSLRRLLLFTVRPSVVEYKQMFCTMASPFELDRRMDRFLRGWAWVSCANIEPFAERVAAWLGVSETPRCARWVMEGLGFHIVRTHLPSGTLAVWTREDGRYTVRLSPFLSRPAANFTLWHEWMDILMARPAFPTPLGPHAAERLADRFAACVTMPRREVLAQAALLAGSGEKSAVLAARFGVSRSAMGRRLLELKRELLSPALPTPRGMLQFR